MELAPKETIFKSRDCFSGACVHYAHIFHVHQTTTRWVQVLFEPLHLPCAASQSAPVTRFQCALFWLNLTPAKASGSFTTIFNGSRGNQT